MHHFPETPIQPVYTTAEGHNEIFVKRDDLLPFSYGGNKVRIARAFVEDMKAKGADSLIFYGDRRSNLCRVLAAICRIEGIPGLMIATEEHKTSEREPFNSALIRSCGVPILDCDKSAIAETVDKAFDMLKAQGHKPYYIYGDRTGSGNEGTAARAYAAAYGEIASFEEREGQTFDLIVTPYGTGATYSGLIAGAMERGEERTIVGISISSRTYERAYGLLMDGIMDYFGDRSEVMRERIAPMIHLETQYNKGGYGLYDDEVEAVIDRCLKAYSLPTDPTYTGKAFLGMEQYLKDRGITNSRVLFLHTGGLPLHFDYLAEKE